MRILVTGGAGFVGSTLVGMLLDAGHHVRVLDNLMYGGRSLLPYFTNNRFHLTVGDIRDERTVALALHEIDAVVHLAAIVGYPACKKDERLAREVNDGGTKMVSSVCNDIPLVFASTGSVYGIVEDEICTEETPARPVSTYSETKLAAEGILRGTNSVILRFATGFGVSPRMRLDTVVNSFCYQAMKTSYLVVYEKAHRRTFVHVGDMARSIMFTLDNHERMSGQVYNVGDESMNVSKETIAHMVRRDVDYFLHFAEIKSDSDERNYEVSYEKIRALGFYTRVRLEQGIEELIQAMKVVDVKHEFTNV